MTPRFPVWGAGITLAQLVELQEFEGEGEDFVGSGANMTVYWDIKERISRGQRQCGPGTWEKGALESPGGVSCTQEGEKSEGKRAWADGKDLGREMDPH